MSKAWESARNGEAEKHFKKVNPHLAEDEYYLEKVERSLTAQAYRAGADFGRSWRAGELEEKLEKAIQLFRDEMSCDLHRYCVDRGYVEVLQSNLSEAWMEIERLGGKTLKARHKEDRDPIYGGPPSTHKTECEHVWISGVCGLCGVKK